MLITYDSPYLSHLALTADDQTRTEALIVAAGKAMARYCGRLSFESAEYDEVRRIKTDEVFLSVRPVDHISRVFTEQLDCLYLTCSATLSTFSTSTAGLYLRAITDGEATDTALTYDDNPSLADLVEAINMVDGWTAIVASFYDHYPSADLVAGQYGQPTTAVRLWRQSNNLFEANYNQGILRLYGIADNGWLSMDSYSPTFLPKEARVIYTAGYSDIPEDLQKVCAEIVCKYAGDSSTVSNNPQALNVMDLTPISKQILNSYRDRIV